ncbi:MAG: hypothetical protein AB7O37_03860 [Vicinamibacteria bacterium]
MLAAAQVLPASVIAGWWLVFGGAFLGAGLLLRRLLRLGPPDALGLIQAFWSGFAVAVALLQVWNLLLPVDRLALAVVVAFGLGGLALEARPLVRLARAAWSRAPAVVLLGIGLVAWAANRALGPVLLVDAGLYYMPTVAWLQSYPVVPGLGNLHGRLAFNSSYFLYGALANVGPPAGIAHHVANGVLFCGLLLQGLAGATALALRVERLRSFHLWATLGLVPVLRYIFGVERPESSAPPDLRLDGLAPDDAVFALTFVCMGLLVALLACHPELSPRERSSVRLTLSALLIVGVTVKLSFAGFAVGALAVVYAAAVARERPAGARAWWLLLGPLAGCLLLIGGVWAARGVILSGYPSYPSTFGAFPVPWRVPEALVISEANWVRSWARLPRVHWSLVLDNHFWLRGWLYGLPPLYTEALGLTFSGLLAGVIAASAFGVSRPGLIRGGALLAPPAVSVLFWFVTAPNYRFGTPAIWSLALGAVFLSTELILARLVEPARRTLVGAGVALLLLVHVAPYRNPPFVSGDLVGANGFPRLPTQPYSVKQTLSGLRVFQSDWCWDVPLPCTPYFREGLRLRAAGDLGAGFVLESARQFVDMHGSELPAGVEASPELGVALPGWHAYDAERGVRWMADEGAVLIYSDARRKLRLTLRPGAIHEPGAVSGFGSRGRIRLRGDRQPVVSFDATSEEDTGTELIVEPGFTKLVLALEAGAFVPRELDAHSDDTRRLSVSFSRIALAVVGEAEAAAR